MRTILIFDHNLSHRIKAKLTHLKQIIIMSAESTREYESISRILLLAFCCTYIVFSEQALRSPYCSTSLCIVSKYNLWLFLIFIIHHHYSKIQHDMLNGWWFCKAATWFYIICFFVFIMLFVQEKNWMLVAVAASALWTRALKASFNCMVALEWRMPVCYRWTHTHTHTWDLPKNQQHWNIKKKNR